MHLSRYHRYHNTDCSKDAGFKEQGKTNKLNNNNEKTKQQKCRMTKYLSKVGLFHTEKC